MDGVVLYNPIRIFRPWIVVVKKLLGKDRKEKTFYVPKTKVEEFLWNILHKTSYKIADGLDLLKYLKDEGIIEPYLITARYKSLEKDFNDTMEKLKARHLFKVYVHNTQNEQPHLFKERMIKKYNLDMFIDDNWDIVEHLSQVLPSEKVTIVWLSNFFDRGIDYPYKVFSLKEFLLSFKHMEHEKQK